MLLMVVYWVEGDQIHILDVGEHITLLEYSSNIPPYSSLKELLEKETFIFLVTL